MDAEFQTSLIPSSSLQTTSLKPTISSLILSTFVHTNSNSSSSSSSKKKHFSSGTLRGLGCASFSRSDVVPTSVHRHAERVRKMNPRSNCNTKQSNSVVVAPVRRMVDEEKNQGEIMMIQTSLLLARTDAYDRYRELRLDVDNMSYEELLDLGERIGHVSTGLREEDIFFYLQKIKFSISDALPSQLSTGLEFKCSICQEEYEADDELGKLHCGHGYHIYCIKQWLLNKNACPICKAAASQC
ncbi:E3 ubiquitin-protein ligase MBR1-like isoform X2 [Tasmannia lanceolata]|uniref:E3 ubiquitin-protein ligase MBR1-like isoform X2 n=1 Tax=Tasmannia lanceolata TaxID=3420 RepID=UPI004064B604